MHACYLLSTVGGMGMVEPTTNDYIRMTFRCKMSGIANVKKIGLAMGKMPSEVDEYIKTHRSEFESDLFEL